MGERLMQSWAGPVIPALPFVVLAALVGTAPAYGACVDLDRELRAAIKAKALERFPSLHRKMLLDASCNSRYRRKVGRVLALASLRHLRSRANKPTDVLPLSGLERAARFGRPWQVQTALGDAYYEAKKYASAVQAYEGAIDDIRDVAANPKAPPKKVEVYLAKRAYQARALAPKYVVTRKFRGRPGGLAISKFRNFTAESVPVPVRFKTNESVLTADGETAVKDILSYVLGKKIAVLRVIGHTDPRGTDAYNKKLSLARAVVVKNYLHANGYQGKIEVVGAGESQPFRADDPGKYSDLERFTFDRRVEYQIIE